MRKSLFLLIAFLFLLISEATPAFAQESDPVGSVIALRGKVTASDTRGVIRELSIKSPIFRHDTLSTGPQGRIQVLFSDNTIVSLGKESRMEIAEHVWNPAQKTGAMKTKVKEGVFRVMGGAIAKEAPEAFTTETPAATIGIRGSMYAGRVAEGSLSVVFEGGKGIYVMNDAGQVSITRPGFGTHTQGQGNPPDKPSRISTQVVSGLNSDLAVSEQTEEDETNVPAQDGQGASAPQDQTDADSSAGEGEPGSTVSQEEPQSSTGDQSSESSDQAPSDAGAGSGEQSRTAQVGESGTGLSTFSATDTNQPADTSSSVSGIERQVTSSNTFFEATLVPSTTNLVTSVTGGDTISQDRLETAVQTSIPGISMSGASMSAMADRDNYWNANNNLFYTESLTGTSSAGLVTCVLTDQNGTVDNFSLSIPPYNPGGTYTSSGIQTRTSSYAVNLLGVDRTFTYKIVTDPLGEFAFYDTLGSFTQTATYEFAELGYVGVPSASTIRTNGVDFYQGRALGFEIIAPDPATPRRDFGSGNTGMEVNWLNGKVIGIMDFDDFSTTGPSANDSKNLMFFFGTIDRTTGTLTNVRFIGSRGVEEKDPTGPVAWIEGSSFSGRFYGSDNQGFGFMSTGNDFDINSSMTTRVGISRLDGAMFRDTQDTADATSPTGTATFSGFVVGVAEQMNSPFLSRREFMNLDPNNFSMTIDRDHGSVTGTLTAQDYTLPADRYLTGIEIGGTDKSAYVLDDRFAAILGDTGNDAVHTYTSQGGLKPYANFLITAKPDEQVNDYVTWGYWEIAYTDPASMQNYHVHQPGAFWVAGERTSSTVIQGMVTNNLTGQYIGTAHGVRFDSASQLVPLTNGVTNILIDFNPSATAPVSGSIQFSEVRLNLMNGHVSGANSQFSADTIISGASSGGAFGAFYGPNAEAVGGNFRAQSGVTTYIGIFNGGKQ